jgi:diacylglycerol diphosphate phosphatase / phosphatidate phosphatase
MAKDRLFSVYNVNGTLTNPELAYPWRHEYIPIWLSGVLFVMVPIVVYLLMALRIRNFWDLNNAIMGTSYAVLGATIFQLIIKTLVGGFRPHFLDLCRPSIPNNGTNVGGGFGSMYVFPHFHRCSRPSLISYNF